MANPTVDKLKALGIRHGEKAVVVIAGVLCLAFIGMAFTAKAPVETTPDQIKSSASQAQSRINAAVAPETVEEKLDGEGLKNVDLAAIVKDEAGNKLHPEKYTLGQGFIKQEPGAGLIRETPELTAPRDVLARFNRGGVKVYAFDKEGNYIIDDPKDDAKNKKGRATQKKGAGSPYGGFGGFDAPANKKKEAENKKKLDREEDQLKKTFAGSKKAEEKKAEAVEPSGPPPKEIVEGKRSIVVTGILDHKAFRESYAKALKLDMGQAHPHYLRVELHRQEMDADGKWSDWAAIDRAKNQGEEFARLHPEKENELATTDALLDPLYDSLPFMSAGYWQGVHRIEFVPEEKQSIQRPPAGGTGGYGPGMGGPGMSAGGYGPGMGGRGGMAGGEDGGSGAFGPGMGGSYGPGMGGRGGMAGMGMGMGGGSSDAINFPTSQASELMLRALDFTVKPNTTYRYKMRVVVKNPNYNKEMVAPDVNTKAQELAGPFSETTPEVTVPSDVTAYVLRKAETSNGQDPRSDKIEFRIAKWLEQDGQIVLKPMAYSPGQILGEWNESVQVPTDGDGVKTERKDLSSRLLLVDTEGGPEPLASLGLTGSLDVPARALILRPDGSVSLRIAARDAADTENRAVYESHTLAIKDSKKKREPGQMSMGMGGEGGMPGMPGMMGGYGGGRR